MLYQWVIHGIWLSWLLLSCRIVDPSFVPVVILYSLNIPQFEPTIITITYIVLMSIIRWTHPVIGDHFKDLQFLFSVQEESFSSSPKVSKDYSLRNCVRFNYVSLVGNSNGLMNLNVIISQLLPFRNEFMNVWKEKCVDVIHLIINIYSHSLRPRG